MTTKQKITDEALTLFSENGYHGTSVKTIANAVGIKDSSLYKHFKSKKDIFDTIVTEMEERMSQLAFQVGLPSGSGCGEDAAAYGKLTLNDLCTLSRKIFHFYLRDSFSSRFWKMAMHEQYHSPDIYAVYHKIFLQDSIAYQTCLFDEMIHQGFFHAIDPQVMAMSFYSPIFFLLSKYMGEPEQEDAALLLLDRQVAEFYRIYRNPDS